MWLWLALWTYPLDIAQLAPPEQPNANANILLYFHTFTDHDADELHALTNQHADAYTDQHLYTNQHPDRNAVF